ncbi:Aldo/keto reductase [Arboricoccus pini]|uniref:Aldo/keto reductase n=1 Tax=Arboricoccus pini TaxID=1963835 RepID=A0A212PZ96_9PROT|nr:aldo/keto reductase [Arboricoccus pini]SNB52425.1 Aldo/keto reductase [Arboricoccus pini]
MHLVQANGARIPALGFGTWELKGADAERMVSAALDIGYRHIDTAQYYGNEVEVGRAVRNSGLPRAEVFVTTKIWPDRFREGDFEVAVEESLDRLRLGYIDLLLLHWPSQTVPLDETMAALDDVKERGLARHVGVSNFTTRLIEESLDSLKAPLVTNQVEYHPFLSQRKLLTYQRQEDIALTAYCPLAQGKVFGHPVIADIAQRYGKNEGQIALRWLVQQEGVIAIPRSAKEANARRNFEIFDFSLEEEEMQRLFALQNPRGRLVESELSPEWDSA